MKTPLPLLKRIVNWSNDVEIAFMETSAKDATNVGIAFERVLNEIYKITAKSAVKEPRSSVTEIKKGRKLDNADDESEVPAKNKGGVHLKAKKPKRQKDGCC